MTNGNTTQPGSLALIGSIIAGLVSRACIIQMPRHYVITVDINVLTLENQMQHNVYSSG